MATRALRPPSILLVSHSVDERHAYARSLRACGYRVINAATTARAYQIATTRPTDMVVTGVHCAGSMSGLELTRRLRIHTRTTTVPIIVLTSVTRRHDGHLSITAGADVFLERPVSGEVLREHVARLLGACGRLSRHSPPAPVSGLQGDTDVSAGGNTRPADHRTCPQCRERLEYRHKSPVLAVGEPNDRQPRERLLYVSGWFCNNATCDYRELAG
jgi:DNA-binding response OmpR family regulator